MELRRVIPPSHDGVISWYYLFRKGLCLQSTMALPQAHYSNDGLKSTLGTTRFPVQHEYRSLRIPIIVVDVEQGGGSSSGKSLNVAVGNGQSYDLGSFASSTPY